MAEWWATLSVAMKVLWGVTLAASLIFIIQSVLTFIGADADSTGLDGGGFDSADMGGGMDAADGSDATVSGGSNLYTFRNLINFLLGFGWSVILLRDSIKPTAVLIFVAALVGLGLVAAVMYMFRLLSKMQPEGDTIPTGTPIKVVEVINESTLLVETLASEII